MASSVREDQLHRLNVLGPLLMGVVFAIAGSYGVGVAIPALYESEAWRRAMQIIACLSFAELVSHWCLTRFTDPSYNTYLHRHHAERNRPIDTNCRRRPETVDASNCVEIGGQPSASQADNVATANLMSRPLVEPESCNVRGTDTKIDIQVDLVLSSDSESVGGNLNQDATAERGQLRQDDRRKRFFRCPNGAQTKTEPTENFGVNGKELDKPFLPGQTSGSSSSTYNWTWSHCAACEFTKPPRCHHCPLCRKCILKRHHHCFFTGICIGAANQRHFIAFMFWGAFVTVFGTAHMLPYAFIHLIASGQASYSDFIPVVALYRCLLGYRHAVICVLSVTFWAVCVFTVCAVVFFSSVVRLTLLGLTDTEYEKKVKVVDTRRLPERLRGVMGDNWLLNFILPVRRKTAFTEDAVHWPYIKRHS